MQRVKSFLSDGSNPNGRWFATDANAIQDAAAALTDLTQHLSVADIALGESSLLLSRFGAGQAQLAGSLRVASGVLPGVFTTTQRDAIAAGKRPPGMLIFNSTTNQLEVNLGTDATPAWQAVSQTTNLATYTPPVRTPVASSTLVIGDQGGVVEMNVITANTLTVPNDSSVAFPVGSSIMVFQIGVGQTTIVAASGVTLRVNPGAKIAGQWAAATLFKWAANDWIVAGNTTP